MEGETLRTRLAKLIQKSRKALRLYSSMGRINTGRNAQYTELQVDEWKHVNAELLKKLTTALERTNSRKLAADVFELRDCFYTEWRMAEADLHNSHKDLIVSAESGDFIKAANVSRELVVLKARVQAMQAAHHEIQDVINRSRVSQPTIELSDDDIVPEQPQPKTPVVKPAKVIPLRQRSGVR